MEKIKSSLSEAQLEARRKGGLANKLKWENFRAAKALEVKEAQEAQEVQSRQILIPQSLPCQSAIAPPAITSVPPPISLPEQVTIDTARPTQQELIEKMIEEIVDRRLTELNLMPREGGITGLTSGISSALSPLLPFVLPVVVRLLPQIGDMLLNQKRIHSSEPTGPPVDSAGTDGLHLFSAAYR
jgi:hypothetical protein